MSLIALALTVFMGKSDQTSLQSLDSSTHAVIALDVASKGIAPKLPMTNIVTNARNDIRFNDHPFPLFYLSGKFMHAFGVSAWSARFIPSLFAVGCVLVLYMIGAQLYSPAVGAVASVILMSSRDFVLMGSRFFLDVPMTFFILLSFYFAFRSKHSLMSVFSGLGLWIKSPVCFLIFPSLVFSYLFSEGLSSTVFRKTLRALCYGMLALGVGMVVWVATGWIGGWDLVPDYWLRQVVGTAVNGRGSENTAPFLGLQLLWRNYFPWVYLLLPAILLSFRRKHWRTPEYGLILGAITVFELVLNSMKFKFYWYFVPIFPFLALLIVDGLKDFIQKYEEKIQILITTGGIAIPALALSLPISFGPENFPALRRFNAIIQHQGSCQDAILFVDGGQPYGTVLDSLYVLKFGTGHPLLEATCVDVNEVIRTFNPKFVILSNPDCVASDLAQSYHSRLGYGTQFLWIKSTKDETKSINLSGLERELVPADYPCRETTLQETPYFWKRNDEK